MPTGTALRAALVGCGRISAYHIAAIQSVAGVEIVAVCDLDAQRAADVAASHGIPEAFDDIGEMMERARPDVVHLVTPPRSHVALARAAAAGGAHMYIEKPFASSTDDANEIVAAAEAAGVELCIGHSRLFDPGFRDALRRVESGEIGRVLSVRAVQGFTYDLSARSAVPPWDHTYDWGIFENLIPHPLSVACHFLDDPGEPKVVALDVGRVREAAVDELRAVIPASNAIGEIVLSLASPEQNTLELVGTHGRIVVDFDSMTTLSWRENGLPSAVNRFGGNFATAWRLAGSSSAVAIGLARGRIKRYMGIRALVAEFYRSLQTGAEMPVTPGQALVTVRLMEQIRAGCCDAAKKRISTGPADAPAGGTQPRVLVTGGSGFLGGRLVERLSEAGVPARATTRLISRARRLPGVEWVECDLTRDADVRRALAGIETVYHCAGMAGPPGSLADYERTNVEGSVRLLELAAEAGAGTLVYISSLAVYGIPEAGDETVDESAGYDEHAPDRGVYTQSKVRAEREVLQHVRAHPAPRVVVLRPGTIYGPGAALPVGLLELPSANRRPIVSGGRRVPVALTYVDNLVDAILAASRSSVPTGSVYNIVDSSDVDQEELRRLVRELSEERIRPVIAPYAAVWLLMLGLDLVSLARHRKLGTARFRLRRTLAPMRFPSTAARVELGWEPCVSLAEGLSNVLRHSPGTSRAEPPGDDASLGDEREPVEAPARAS